VGNGEHAKTLLAGRGDAGLTYSNNSANPKVSEWRAVAQRPARSARVAAGWLQTNMCGSAMLM
jgi:hypothetical protein